MDDLNLKREDVLKLYKMYLTLMFQNLDDYKIRLYAYSDDSFRLGEWNHGVENVNETDEIDNTILEFVKHLEATDFFEFPDSSYYALYVEVDIIQKLINLSLDYEETKSSYDEASGSIKLPEHLKGIYTCDYEGSGDDGYITTEAILLDGEILDQRQYSAMYSDYNDIASTRISREFPGFENNDGGGGKLTIDSSSKTFKIEHEWYDTEMTTYNEYEINLGNLFKKWKLR